MVNVANYYALLGVTPDATKEEVADAYYKKIINVSSDFMSENYKTAYIVLSDDVRRYSYDKSIGIHRYRKVGLSIRAAKVIGRIGLTLLDVICTFYQCFFIAVVMVNYFLKIMSIEETRYDTLLPLIHDICDPFLLNNEELILFMQISIAVHIIHFYIRRANRKLKAVNWEVKIKNNKEEQKNGIHG